MMEARSIRATRALGRRGSTGVTTAAASQAAVVEAKPREGARVAVVIVTWNRRDMVEGALEAVARQDYGAGLLDVVVIDNACPHSSGNLSAGSVYENVVTCPLHQWEFDLDRLRCTHSERVRVGGYPAEIRNGEVWADLPDNGTGSR